MFKNYSFLFIIAFLLVLTSCVSKKKYLEMESGRLRAEQLSKQLGEENNSKAARIEALIADFESMKNELLENNALKDNYIDSLNSEIYVLVDRLNKEKESLETTSFNLDFEKQRLTSALDTKDKTLKSLQSEVERLKTEITDKNTVIDEKNFDIGKMRDQSKVLEEKLKTGEKNLAGLQLELEKVKAETDKLKADMKVKDTEITKLQNNVKLLKSQLGN
jgi:chromosome segregation ATPase